MRSASSAITDAAASRNASPLPYGSSTLVELIGEGNGYFRSWQAMAHGEEALALYDPRGFKKDWQAWGRKGMGLCRAIGIPISRRGAVRGEL
jgi:hypothetical protein